jgi:MFS transporter, OFA family, oxalate/formate antiporter
LTYLNYTCFTGNFFTFKVLPNIAPAESMELSYRSKGWIVAAAALATNLILGILYSWSILQKALVNEWGWTNTEASLPYTVCIATFAVTMIFAGRAQDKHGPKPVAFLGGILFGTGLIASAFTRNPALMIITFGILGGMGIGFGYSAVTPCAIKWFEPDKKGIISGIVVSGVGLSPVYIAPLTHSLLKTQSIEQTFIIMGYLTLTGVTLLSLLLRNPPSACSSVSSSSLKESGYDYSWQKMVKTRPFLLLWLSYLMSAAAGLMLLGHLSGIAFVQAKWQAGFILVVILSIFNALGRVSGGYLSDKAGRTNALLIIFLLQAANMFMFSFYQSIPALIAGAVVAGLSYGALFALFPAITAEFYGIRNLGVNYGLVFTGWGVAGIIGPVIGGLVADMTGTYNNSYIISAIMLLTGALLVKQIKPPVLSYRNESHRPGHLINP